MAFQDSFLGLEIVPQFPADGQFPCHNPESDSSSRPFSCPEPSCGRSFTRKKALQEHIQSPVHANEKPYKCTLCTKRFTRSNDLKRHEAEVHGEKRFVCAQSLPTGERWGCLKRFSRSSTLKQHQKDCLSYRKPKLHPEAQITWFSAPEARARHLARSRVQDGRWSEEWTHEADQFVCKICKVRRQKILVGSFVQHLLDHLENIEYQAFECADCSARFVLQDHLKRHRQVCSALTCVLIEDDLNGVWGCGRAFRSMQEFLRHAQGLDDTNCQGQARGLEEKLRRSLIGQLEDMGFTADSDKYPDFADYVNHVRKEALGITQI